MELQTSAEEFDPGRIISRLEGVPFNRFHLRAAAILGAGTFADSYDALALASALTVIFTVLHVNFASAGVLLAMGYIGQLVGAVCASALAERYGRKALFVAAVLVFGILSLATAFAWNYDILLVLRVLQGLGLGAEVPIAAALFAELIGSRNRGKVYLSYQNLFGWGAFLAPLIASGLIALFGPEVGWRVVLGIGGLPIIVAIVGWRLLPESPRWLIRKGRVGEAARIADEIERAGTAPASVHSQSDTKPAAVLPDPSPTRLRELFGSGYIRRTVLICTMFATSYFVVYSFTVWLPTLYVKVGGLRPVYALLLTACSGMAFVTSGYVFAFVSDRVGRKKYFIACYVLTAIGCAAGVVLIGGFGLTTWQVLFGVTLVLAVGIYPVNIGAYLYSGELFPTRIRAWATGTGSAAQRLATVVAPAIVGLIIGSSKSPASGVSSVFWLLLGITLVGLVAVTVLGIETARKPLYEGTTVESRINPDPAS